MRMKEYVIASRGPSVVCIIQGTGTEMEKSAIKDGLVSLVVVLRCHCVGFSGS